MESCPRTRAASADDRAARRKLTGSLEHDRRVGVSMLSAEVLDLLGALDVKQLERTASDVSDIETEVPSPTPSTASSFDSNSRSPFGSQEKTPKTTCSDEEQLTEYRCNINATSFFIDASCSSDQMLPTHFAWEDTEEFRQIFACADKDADGFITAVELSDLLSNFGLRPTASDFENLMRRLGADSTGKFDFEDILCVMSQNAGDSEEEEELRKAFDMFKADDIALIGPAELRDVCSKLGEHLSLVQCKETISKFDIDGDGYLNYAEFRRMLT